MKRNLSDYFFSTGSAEETDENDTPPQIVVSLLINCSSEEEFAEIYFAFIFFNKTGKSDLLMNEYPVRFKYLC